ncbi:sigma-54-dependent Fis family transcriptional regulator [Shewanella algicola]|uniref:Sigma-54-dependent Fis family transcriptional regulator n=1 Tax=Shewanella algicola TaxID=640633 RepID=A0A9X2CAU4_9GAMM|nr:sigma-54-dependent Fis family transcriptional regulator [Shewanella algicola]MCL1106585.1 sigma-54-dependent Fis family transcriptional regulator [Shewanella algicola]GGP59991.1 sigma-54-dependent Fis family transcriptional regulator [Shewanella algicola]
MKVEDLFLNSLLNHSDKDASVSFMQQRVLIMDSLALGLLRKELIDTLGSHEARKILTRFGYAHGWRTAKMVQDESPDVFNDERGGEQLHKLFGLVNTTKRIEVKEAENDGLLIRTRMENSYEAEQQLNLLGKSTEASCWTLTGFASGYETFKRGREMYFIETKCMAMGDPYCEMEGHFKECWDHRLQEHLPYFQMDNISQTLAEQQSLLKQLEDRLAARRNELSALDNPIDPIPGFLVRSPQMIKVINIATLAAKVNSTILVSGDSGVGKEHISRFIHQMSSRSQGPFISINCSALSDSLLEAELFGHIKGAFTGADKARIGLFEEANGGTLFLDEIGETSLNMQVKLLRVLQERKIKRIGENKERPIDIRVIAATNRHLSDEVKQGHFRKDLFYRLRVIELHIPNLSKRREDILPIANLFLYKFNDTMERDVIGLSHCATQRLMHYAWPGNVRELSNAIEYAVALCRGRWIEETDLPAEIINPKAQLHAIDPLKSLEDIEKQHIEVALKYHNGDKRAAAASLGIVLSTLYRKLSHYQLS